MPARAVSRWPEGCAHRGASTATPAVPGEHADGQEDVAGDEDDERVRGVAVHADEPGELRTGPHGGEPDASDDEGAERRDEADVGDALAGRPRTRSSA